MIRLHTIICAIAIAASLVACGGDDPDPEPDPVPPTPQDTTTVPPADTTTVQPVDTTATPEPPADGWPTAKQVVAAMHAGWNLGNTLDSNSGDTTNMWIEKYTSRRPVDYETAWGQPQATPELIKMFADAGFDAIRVPVTWYPHTDADGHVDEAWMQRVVEVVGYVLDAGLYCILNVHHDTGAANTAWIQADEAVYAATRERYATLWTEIATRFRDCDHHLVFEGYNEMLDTRASWNYAQTGSTAYRGLNSYAQTFVDAVRATGGNNEKRVLVVTTYSAACGGSGNMNLVLSNLTIPDDPAGAGRIAVEAHNYAPWQWDKNHGKWTTSNAKQVADDLRRLNTWFVDKGYPVIVGEYGATEATKGDEAEVVKYVTTMVTEAAKYDMATFYWMGLSDGADRSVPQWTLPAVKDAIIEAAGR